LEDVSADVGAREKRLLRLADNVAQPFEALVGQGDAIERWCKRVKELRNNIGHGDPVPLHQSAAELYEMSESAYWLFVLNLLVEAKAPHAVYHHLMTMSRRFLFLSKQVRQYY
jgi:HEPN superfamily Apea-like protein